METIKPTAQIEFEKAIESGRLSNDKNAPNYWGNYMYMGKNANGKALFKNVRTRDYIE